MLLFRVSSLWKRHHFSYIADTPRCALLLALNVLAVSPPQLETAWLHISYIYCESYFALPREYIGNIGNKNTDTNILILVPICRYAADINIGAKITISKNNNNNRE